MTALAKYRSPDIDNWISEFLNVPTLFGRFERLLDPTVSIPPLDLVEHENESVATLFMPHINKENVKITISGREVEVTASTEAKTEKKEGETVLYSEQRASNMYRRFILPHKVDIEKSTAEMINSTLTLTLAKSKDAITNQLTVK